MIFWKENIVVSKPFEAVVKENTLDNLLVNNKYITKNNCIVDEKHHRKYKQTIEIAGRSFDYMITIVTVSLSNQALTQGYSAYYLNKVAGMGTFEIHKTEDGQAEVKFDGRLERQHNAQSLQDFFTNHRAEILKVIVNETLANMR